MVGAMLTGAFPRSDDLIEVSRAYDRKLRSEEDLTRASIADAQAVIGLEKAAGLDFISDGQLNWQDLLRPLAEALPEVHLGPLTRWYDNNTFYRKPIITQRLAQGKPVAAEYYRTDLLPKGSPWQAILPGPYTLSRLVEDKAYGKGRDLLLDLSDTLAREARRLDGLGFKLLQISEPSLATDPPSKEMRGVLEGAIANIVRGVGAEIILHTYFGDPTEILEFLLDLPVNYLGLDFYQASVGNVAQVDFDKGLVCGCVDARNSLVEPAREVREFAAKVREKVEPKGLYIAPNADLDFLPRDVAEEKLAVLGKAARGLEGEET